MSEQQRIFLAVALCLGIMLLWPFLMGQEQPSEKAAPGKSPASNEQVAAGTPETTPPTVPPSSLEEAPTGDGVQAGAPSSPAPTTAPDTRRPFETEVFSGELSSVDASLTALALKNYNEQAKEEESEEPKSTVREPVSLVTAQHDGVARQARLVWKLGADPAPPLTWKEGGEGFLLTGERPDGVRTEVLVVPREGTYALDYSVKAHNATEQKLPVGLTVSLSLGLAVKKKSSWFSPPVNLTNGVCALAEGVERNLDSDLVEDGPWRAPSSATWAAIDRQYFVVAVMPKEKATAACTMSVKDERIMVDYTLGRAPLEPGESWQQQFSVFLGPKRNESLEGVSPELREVIDYSIWGIPLGFLARPMVFLLNVFHGWTASWGVAIMLLTLLVKTLLFPVTYKSSVSMRKMQLLRPELDKLKKQFDGDRERQQTEQMKLFKDKGVNPLGGCLPMLLQMPVWFALYRTLWTAVDLYQQPFLWLPDLTAKEPLPVMAFVIGGLTFLQQKMMPTATDSQQAKMMMYFMPVMLTVFMIALPSGLVLYILFNSVLTLVQQLVINKRTTKLA